MRHGLRVAAALWLILGGLARAEDAVRDGEADPGAGPVSTPEAPSTAQAAGPAAPARVRLGGYIETAWQWNFNRPANSVTNFRGFDNRHATFTLSNVALDAAWDAGPTFGRLTLQVGTTPAAYTMAEPGLAGTPSVNASDSALWRHVQQALVGWRGGDLELTAGVFLSPVGPETIPIRDSWSWSRSNPFFALPYYHTGVRAALQLGGGAALSLGLLNGWNSVIDNNDDVSLCLQFTLNRPTFALSALWFGGVERARGAAEGRPWRHLFDLHATWHVTPWLSLLAHVDAGFEAGDATDTRWATAAAYARVAAGRGWAFTARLDAVREWGRLASRILTPVEWVGSGTLTVERRVAEGLILRLEGRHDRAAQALYFDAESPLTGASPATTRQSTLTLGAIASF